MLNKTEIQVNAIVAELKAQRNAAGDRAANIAAELAIAKAENEVLQARIRNLEEQLNKQGENA